MTAQWTGLQGLLKADLWHNDLNPLHALARCRDLESPSLTHQMRAPRLLAGQTSTAMMLDSGSRRRVLSSVWSGRD